jgi:hypothetical protein
MRRLRQILCGLAVIAVLVAAPAASFHADATSQASPPIGNVETVSETAGGWVVYGWMWDRDTHRNIVEAMSDGWSAGAAYTEIDRPDVAATYPGAPVGTGFRLRLSRPVSSPVCVVADNANGDRATLGCLSIPPATYDGSPSGTVDELRAEVGRVVVRGWVVDPDPDPATTYGTPPRGARAVHVYVDGQLLTPLDADKPRPDVAALVPHAEANDGFEVLLPARTGRHQICVYGINQGRTGRNVTLGCRDLDVPAYNGPGAPIGSLDGEYACCQTGGTATYSLGVRGWSMTPHGGPVRVRVVALGGFYANPEQLTDQTGSTGVSRPDVPAVYPGAPADTGYEIVGGGGPFFHFRLACATAQALDTGAETALGCVTNSGTAGGQF